MVKCREVYVGADAAGCRCYYAETRQHYEQIAQIRQENQPQRHINLHGTQGDDPLWSDGDDWEDALPGGCRRSVRLRMAAVITIGSELMRIPHLSGLA